MPWCIALHDWNFRSSLLAVVGPGALFRDLSSEARVRVNPFTARSVCFAHHSFTRIAKWACSPFTCCCFQWSAPPCCWAAQLEALGTTMEGMAREHPLLWLPMVTEDKGDGWLELQRLRRLPSRPKVSNLKTTRNLLDRQCLLGASSLSS